MVDELHIPTALVIQKGRHKLKKILSEILAAYGTSIDSYDDFRWSANGLYGNVRNLFGHLLSSCLYVNSTAI